MAITMRKYVDITSGVGGASQVKGRELIARLFSSSPMLSPQTAYELTTVEDVAALFGVSSDEYASAAMYFGTISKSITKPRKISFYRYTPVATFAALYGTPVKTTLAQFASLQIGTIDLKIDGAPIALAMSPPSGGWGFNWGNPQTVEGLAGYIQGQLISAGVAGADVKFNPVTKVFTLKTTGMTITQATGSLAALLGWDTGIAVNGATVDASPLAALMASDNLSSNFGSFAFLDALSLQQHIDIAAYNSTLNVKYMYLLRVLAANTATWSAALMDYSGVSLNLVASSTDYLIMGVAASLAATDYTRPNSTINYMFTQYAAPVTVTDTTVSNAMDALRVNYYGQTQTAGNNLSFYQRGLLTGLATAPTDMNTYANEMWLKDSVTTAIMNLFLAMPKLSANRAGQAQIYASIMTPIADAVLNGTVSRGKTLDTTQRIYVATLSNDPTAYRSVESAGYWLNVILQKRVTSSGTTEFVAVYTLIYSKDDAIRKVEGTHALI